MNTVDLMATIGRLRRAQPRNPDTQAVCDALEKMLIKTSAQKVARVPLSDAAQAARRPQPPMQLLDAIQEPLKASAAADMKARMAKVRAARGAAKGSQG